MKKITIAALAIFIVTLLGTLQSCKDEKDPEPEVNEFVADDATFSGFMMFPVGGTFNGANPALGGMAHGGNDSTVTRVVHFKNDQARVNGVFPLGTVIVKHSTNPKGMNEITAMVKRGNNFNPGKGDWEFFMLNADGTVAKDPTGIPMRGANLMNGMCVGCHSSASKDFVFSKP